MDKRLMKRRKVTANERHEAPQERKQANKEIRE